MAPALSHDLYHHNLIKTAVFNVPLDAASKSKPLRTTEESLFFPNALTG